MKKQSNSNSTRGTRYPTAEPMETPYQSGQRYIPVRLRDGEMFLDTNWVAFTPEEAVKGARRTDRHEMGAEWAEDNLLVGVAVVTFDILDMRPLQNLGLAGL